MSYRNHPMCMNCWNERHEDRAPVGVTDPDEEICCWCGGLTTRGIYVRASETEVNECACTERGQ